MSLSRMSKTGILNVSETLNSNPLTCKLETGLLFSLRVPIFSFSSIDNLVLYSNVAFCCCTVSLFFNPSPFSKFNYVET